MSNPDKYYCYVDESGQDTEGNFFIVSVIILGRDRDQCLLICEEIENETKKGKLKWIKCREEYKYAYIDCILNTSKFMGKLTYSIFHGSKDYPQMTVEAIAWAIDPIRKNKITVLVDALPRAHEKEVGITLRKRGYKTRKVRGVRKDENDALIRLADALCGLVRDALCGNKKAGDVLDKAEKTGFILPLKTKNPK